MKDKKMASGYSLTEFTLGQRHTYRTTVEIYRAFLEAGRQCRAFKGGMHWKKIGGKDYLYRYRDRLGHGESLGPRSGGTERLFAGFTRERREALGRLQREGLRLQEQRRYCRAAKLQRLPRGAARILRRLEEHPAGQDLLVVGAAAVYAYEAAAGVFLDFDAAPGLPAASRRLTLAGEMSWEELLNLLKRTDRSFAPLADRDCRAANRDGFQVQLLKPGIRRPGKPKTVTLPGAQEPLPLEAGNLQYLLASPRLSQVVIGADGGPATMAVPDALAFALNKFWRSRQEDREEAKRRRDFRQALAVADLVLRYLQPYEYFSLELDMLPQDLVQAAARFAEGTDASGREAGA